MAPKKKSEVEGVLTKVARMFNAGELIISVDSALKQVSLCTQYTKSGGCPMRCKKIHVNKRGQLCPSVGLSIACELERDPASHPGVRVDPVLALQAFLLANHSPLVVDHVYERENALVFLFAEQHISSVVKQIARQRWVRVDVCGHLKILNATDESAPSLTLHGVKQDSLQSSLNILVNGFNYGTESKPFGIYSVDANIPEQSGRIKSYDGGAAIVLKPTGFVANVSDINAAGKPRDNTNAWVTGARFLELFCSNVCSLANSESSYCIERVFSLRISVWSKLSLSPGLGSMHCVIPTISEPLTMAGVIGSLVLE